MAASAPHRSPAANHRPPSAVGLDLTFDLLASIGGGLDDQLADPASAARWLTDARGVPAGVSALTPAELTRLRELRDDLRTVLHGGDITERATTIAVELGIDGSARLAPLGANANLVASEVLLEIAMAQRDNTWARVKLCRNTRCDGVFFDRSRNNSGVWHDVNTCGNAENLRASRARRKAAENDVSNSR